MYTFTLTNCHFFNVRLLRNDIYFSVGSMTHYLRIIGNVYKECRFLTVSKLFILDNILKH